MSKRDVALYIVDIFIAIDKIERYTQTFGNGSELLSSELHWDASIRELEIIGEATKYLLDDALIENRYRRIVDFRNQIAHGYFGIDENIVWDVVTNKLCEYKKDLEDIVVLLNIDLSFAILHAKNEFCEHENVLAMLKKLEYKKT